MSEPNMLEEIEKEMKKLPEPPWFAADDLAPDCPDHKNSSLALVDTGRSDDWPIARLCEWGPARWIAKSPERIAALLDYVRAAEEFRKRYFVDPYGDATQANYDWHAARAKLGLK